MTEPLIPDLVDAGLILQAVIDIDCAPDIAGTLVAAGVDIDRMRSLVLLGQAGTRLWDRHVRHNLDRADPFDDTSRDLVTTWFEHHHPNATWEVVYPGETLLPLGQLAEQVGWGRPSPLGLTIHSHYGLWIAHRIGFVTDLEFDRAPNPLEAAHPCDDCADKPCETACPVGAVSSTSGFDVLTCANHRAPVGSGCEFRCPARSACPVGLDYAYGDTQMKHHYSAGLTSIRRWLHTD